MKEIFHRDTTAGRWTHHVKASVTAGGSLVLEGYMIGPRNKVEYGAFALSLAEVTTILAAAEKAIADQRALDRVSV